MLEMLLLICLFTGYWLVLLYNIAYYSGFCLVVCSSNKNVEGQYLYLKFKLVLNRKGKLYSSRKKEIFTSHSSLGNNQETLQSVTFTLSILKTKTAILKVTCNSKPIQLTSRLLAFYLLREQWLGLLWIKLRLFQIVPNILKGYYNTTMWVLTIGLFI